MKVILATHNQGKIREFQKRFSEIGWEVIPISDIADIPEPEETGTTFRENALQKARYYAEAVNLPVLSDDSGIIADVLGNEPGVYWPGMQAFMGMTKRIIKNWWKFCILIAEKHAGDTICA